MKSLEEIKNIQNLRIQESGYDGGMGFIYLNGIKAKPANVVWSNGRGWDHVSVSYENRCPTWEEMCKIKDAFFKEEETAIQYHPAKSEYVNLHPYCLHLWRAQSADKQAVLPDKFLV